MSINISEHKLNLIHLISQKISSVAKPTSQINLTGKKVSLF